MKKEEILTTLRSLKSSISKEGSIDYIFLHNTTRELGYNLIEIEPVSQFERYLHHYLYTLDVAVERDLDNIMTKERIGAMYDLCIKITEKWL